MLDTFNSFTKSILSILWFTTTRFELVGTCTIIAGKMRLTQPTSMFRTKTKHTWLELSNTRIQEKWLLKCWNTLQLLWPRTFLTNHSNNWWDITVTRYCGHPHVQNSRQRLSLHARERDHISYDSYLVCIHWLAPWLQRDGGPTSARLCAADQTPWPSMDPP